MLRLKLLSLIPYSQELTKAGRVVPCQSAKSVTTGWRGGGAEGQVHGEIRQQDDGQFEEDTKGEGGMGREGSERLQQRSSILRQRHQHRVVTIMQLAGTGGGPQPDQHMWHAIKMSRVVETGSCFGTI